MKNLTSENGITLIEIIASVVILSIIIISIIPIFVQSSLTNNVSKNVTDSTYLAQKEMEEVINMNSESKSPSLSNLSSQLLKKGYIIDNTCSNCLEVYKDDHYISIQLKSISDTLGKVIIKVYKDNNKNKHEAQMEMVLSWTR